MQSNGARALVALAGIAVIVAAFFVFSGGDDSDDGDTGTTVATTTTGKQGNGTEQQPAQPAAETIEVAGGQPADGEPAELAYSQGDEVNIVVKADEESEFHLHGYDIEEEATPEKPAEFQFTADIEGKFELEDHHSEALIAELTVNP